MAWEASPKIGSYDRVPAPPTIRATLEATKTKYGVEILLVGSIVHSVPPRCSTVIIVNPPR